MSTINVDSSRSQSSSASHSSTTLRTRSRRPASDLENAAADDSSLHGQLAADASTFLSPLSSRAASPIPNKHPSRSSSNQANPRNSSYNQSKQPYSDLSAQFNDLWGNSWSALQGLASNVLGSDISPGLKDKSSQRARRPREATHSPIRGQTSTGKWGPSPDAASLGAGTQEERQAMVRARKRQELLMVNGSSSTNSALAHKRRNSDDMESMSAPPGEWEDRETLVYLHHVQPNDTLAGISIKFGCSLSVLRSSNRMWSNDTVQTKKIIVIPVDACNVRGRRVDPDQVDLLQDNVLDGSKGLQRKGSSSTIKPADMPSSLEAPSMSLSKSEMGPSDQTWTHDSWVHIGENAVTVEIVRLRRRDLAFFPPARRKSVTLSIGDKDIPRIALDAATTATPLPAADAARPAPSRTMSPSRPRATSNTSAGSGATGFAYHMLGPGGVGRLVGKSPVRGPGPSEDKLTKFFSGLNLSNAAAGTASSSSAPSSAGLPHGIAHRTSFDSEISAASGGASGLENVGGAIEGWMRKVASRAARIVEPGSPLMGPSRGGQLGGRRQPGGVGAGDLIELSDASELGDEDASAILQERGSTLDDWDHDRAKRGRRRLSAVDEQERLRMMGADAPPKRRGK